MKQPRTNQAGFSAGAIVAIVLVIVVIGGVGFVVFQKSSNKAATTTASTPGTKNTVAEPDAQPAATAKQYLVIKEWGVQLSLDNTTSTLYYYINPKVPDVAYLSLKTVSDIAPNCAADKVSLAAIGRLTEAQQEAAVSKPSVLNRPGTIQIGSYWYGYSKPNAGCVENSAQSDAINTAQPSYDLQTVFRTIQTSSSSN